MLKHDQTKQKRSYKKLVRIRETYDQQHPLVQPASHKHCRADRARRVVALPKRERSVYAISGKRHILILYGRICRFSIFNTFQHLLTQACQDAKHLAPPAHRCKLQCSVAVSVIQLLPRFTCASQESLKNVKVRPEMKKQILISLGALLGFIFAGLFMVFSTNPDRVGPIGVTIFFFIVFGGFFVIFDLAWRIATRTRRQPRYNLYFISVLAGLPTMLLALQTLQQLQLRDVGVVIILASLIIFYLSKRQQN